MANKRSEDYHAYPTLWDSQRTSPELAIDWDGHETAALVVSRRLAAETGGDGIAPDDYLASAFCPQPQPEITQYNFLPLVDAVNPPPKVDILFIEPTQEELNQLGFPDYVALLFHS